MDNRLIKMDLKEIGINTRKWVDSAQDRDYYRGLVNAALNLNWGSFSPNDRTAVQGGRSKKIWKMFILELILLPMEPWATAKTTFSQFGGSTSSCPGS